MNVAEDMHPEDVKAAIRKRGMTLGRLATENGFHFQAVQTTLRKPWPNVEFVIAEFLGKKPQEIWPSRYLEDGSPKSTKRVDARRLEIMTRVHGSGNRS